MKKTTPFINSGFTLLELLLTLTIFSFIMFLLLDSYFQFHHHGKKTDEIFLLRQEVRTLKKILSEDLSSAIFLTRFISDPLLNRKTGILGINNSSGDNELDEIHLHVNQPSRFYRELPFDFDPLIHEVSYFIEENQEQKLLFKRREEYYIDNDIKGGERSLVYTISENLIYFDVKYYDKKNPQVEPRDAWESQPRNPLPGGIEVTLILKTAKGSQLKETFQVNINPYMGSFIE